MDVEYNPALLFSPVIVTMEIECFFCPKPITPEKNDWLIQITIPGKNIASVHDTCFEQMAWSMTKFVMDTNGKTTPPLGMN